MIRKMEIGDQRIYERMITTEDVKKFGELTGDMNKTHFDEAYAAGTVFKKPIVHGMLIGSLFSRIFGLDYPGEGTIYCSQSIKFLKPVYPNTIITVVATVKEIILEKNRVIFTTEIFDENKNCVLTGEAALMPRKEQFDE
ncbi:MaoC family dehydratase [Peloplasma aerotolerans]|uniref:MaoC family dehydratase n=1 Tax=Peloplasma aerotolerans TaxID=3044389 RepID=A0AAW6U9J0_9MOLU|nr:MaoC family dehydratase [Mariniplasma sp. M4Ah]MDI6453344.1 MaoC family dehydratase [Mariniplasma sp. M4Ah]MDR4968095.1 MaoC family dehydratase [Acholeplasmataceae bacterium]